MLNTVFNNQVQQRDNLMCNISIRKLEGKIMKENKKTRKQDKQTEK